jgi:TfoX/Sxy family transcriptional regulator of competence genes
MADPAKNERIREMEMALGAALAEVQPDAHLSWKAMFGGAGYYVDGVMFAAWFGAGLALKLAEANRAELVKIDGAVQSQSQQYIEVPPTFLDDPHLLETWVKRSVDFVSVPKPRKPRKKSG